MFALSLNCLYKVLKHQVICMYYNCGEVIIEVEFTKMKKVYVLPPSEDWIVDRFVKEWNQDNSDISVMHPKDADVVWLLADWAWDQLARIGWLMNKKVITTVHHIVPEKFSQSAINNFMLRDKITSVYHVYNEHTRDFIIKFTKKEIDHLNSSPSLFDNEFFNITPTLNKVRKWVDKNYQIITID